MNGDLVLEIAMGVVLGKLAWVLLELVWSLFVAMLHEG